MIKNSKSAINIYKRALEALSTKDPSSASSAISLYIDFYESQDFGNNNKIFLPYIKNFNEAYDCEQIEGSQKKTLSNSGIDKIKKIIDSLDPIVNKKKFSLKSHSLIILGIFLITLIMFFISNKEYNSNDIRIAKNIVTLLTKNDSIYLDDVYHATGAFTNYLDIYKKYNELPKLRISKMQEGFEIVCKDADNNNKDKICGLSREAQGEMYRMYNSLKAFIETAEEKKNFTTMFIPKSPITSIFDWIYLILKIIDDLGIISLIGRAIRNAILKKN